MKSFNIQVDNLWYNLVGISLSNSQFLPQDRVASFAQLSPTQLLHETQRAVGGDEMVAHWERLCALRAEERELQAVSPRTKPVSQSLDLYIGRPKRFQNPGK